MNLFVLIESSSYPHPHRNTPANNNQVAVSLLPFCAPSYSSGAGVEVGVLADI